MRAWMSVGRRCPLPRDAEPRGTVAQQIQGLHPTREGPWQDQQLSLKRSPRSEQIGDDSNNQAA